MSNEITAHKYLPHICQAVNLFGKTNTRIKTRNESMCPVVSILVLYYFFEKHSIRALNCSYNKQRYLHNSDAKSDSFPETIYFRQFN